jgi:hypothetical protein
MNRVDQSVVGKSGAVSKSMIQWLAALTLPMIDRLPTSPPATPPNSNKEAWHLPRRHPENSSRIVQSERP